MEEDTKLRALLRADAPPGRDPFFRIALLERRTHQQYRRRQRTVLVTAILAAVLGAAALNLTSTFGRDLLRGETLRIALVILFCVALLLAGFASVRGLQRALRQLRGS